MIQLSLWAPCHVLFSELLTGHKKEPRQHMHNVVRPLIQHTNHHAGCRINVWCTISSVVYYAPFWRQCNIHHVAESVLCTIRQRVYYVQYGRHCIMYNIADKVLCTMQKTVCFAQCTWMKSTRIMVNRAGFVYLRYGGQSICRYLTLWCCEIQTIETSRPRIGRVQ